MARVFGRPDRGRIASRATRSREGRSPESFIGGSQDWYFHVDTNWRTVENYNCRGINQKLVGAVGIEPPSGGSEFAPQEVAEQGGVLRLTQSRNIVEY